MAEKRRHRKMTREEQEKLSSDVYEAGAHGGREAHAARIANIPLVRPTEAKSSYARELFDYDESPDAQKGDRRRGAARSAHASNPGTRAQGGAHYAQKRQEEKRRHPVLKGILVSLLVLAAIGGVAVAWYINVINGKLSGNVSEDLRHTLVSVKKDEPFYMLLLGVDKSDDRASDWGSDQSNFRADTIILARVDPKTAHVTLISIPRDTRVNMGEHGEQKINQAYSYGGAAYMTKVVAEFAGVNISHYAEIDFEQFASVVNTLGGIEVTLPVPVKDTRYMDLDLPAGTQTLDGWDALDLVRTRHAYDAYGAGDYYRAANQRMVIASIISKILSSDVASWPGLISKLADGVTTDMTADQLISLAYQFQGMNTDTNIYSARCPTTSSYIDGVWYEIVNQSAWKAMIERTNKGEAPYQEGQADETAGIAGSAGSGAQEKPRDPIFSGSVLALNGTSTSGLASKAVSILTKKGFSASAGNSSSNTRTDTVVVYNESRSSQAYQEALGVVQALGLSTEPVANDGSYSTETDVVVVLGSDYAKS